MKSVGNESESSARKMIDIENVLEKLSSNVLELVKNTQESEITNQKQFELSENINENIATIGRASESNAKNINEIFQSVQCLDSTVEKSEKIINQFRVSVI
jgi:methyl-accepting chemotaxis protein